MKNVSDYIALALDNSGDLNALRALIGKTAGSVGVYKLGLEQFTRFGPGVLDIVRDTGRKVFLDLKFHDIPNTVAKAVEAACALGVDYMTIHTQGGTEMMRAAAEAASKADRRPKILGVTLLTSIDQTMLNEDLSVQMKTAEYVLHLAKKAVGAGLGGLVCSAADLEMVAPAVPDDFEIVTPGIRPAGADVNDQKRVATPSWAIKNGAGLLVIGRPITGANDPGKAAADIVNEIAGILK
ncbi:MAG: orotidine-5'-phosphate decarboxylase [Chitinispirillia bacterium]|nr:orotidine-5'-phosphate decarboxylase [Chitinispirillia bacterium]MCL2241906.1 orotidine-5'-phosphate decarboxylase [Chitinispirillia bacterium]